MVRLKECVVHLHCTKDALFQFQYGAIKRKRKDVLGLTLNNFNSNMVRLKGRESRKSNHQKHHFNSNMVRLKATTENFERWRENLISIPIWCD